MRELRLDERSFFSLEKSFHVYIEKYPPAPDRVLSVALFLDTEKNKQLAEKYNEFVIVLHGVVEMDRVIVTNVTTRAVHTPVHINWRRPANLLFDVNFQRGERVALDLLNLIHEMPVAQESSTYVKKRIASWEGYLKIQERSADIPDMTTSFSGLIFNGDFTRVTITGLKLGEKEWKSLKDLSVKLKGIDQDIGKVLKANRSGQSIEVELHGYMEERARKQRLDVSPKEVVFSNFATLSQVKRLRQGFKHLENGLAVNPDLERLLFENKPPVQPPKKQAVLKFHNRLNEFQREAVTGAMSAEDLYVIQGPPGTGKTTVISEICLQNAKAGLRTLVASQSNLAVDNALGRLLANKDIRILRVGRTESIEEEGKKFIEENVGQYWKDHTLQEVSSQFEARHNRESEIEAEWEANQQEQERLEPELERLQAEMEAKQRAEQQFNEIQSLIDEQEKKVEEAEQEQKALLKKIQDSKKSLNLLNAELEKENIFLQTEPDRDTIQKEWEANEQLIQRLQNSLALEILEADIADKKQTFAQTLSKCEMWSEEVNKTEALAERVKEIKQIDGLKWVMLEQNMKRSLRMQELMEEIEDIRGYIKQREKLKDYAEKLGKAISVVEQNLALQLVVTRQLEERAKARKAVYTAETIDQFLDRLRYKYKSNVKYDIQDLEGLYSRIQFVWQKAKMLQSPDSYIQMAKEAFRSLKQEVTDELQQKQRENKVLYQKWQRTLEEEKATLQSLENKQKQLSVSAESIPNAKEMLKQKEAISLELKEKQELYSQVKKRFEENSEKQAQEVMQLEEAEQQLVVSDDCLNELNVSFIKWEEEQKMLKDILASEPEAEHEKVLTQLASLSLRRESMKQEKKRLPLFQSIQGKWLSLLEEASEHDLDEIRKLYVKHANVIGTTCVASARKDFIDSYPEFDVVIIDEVSKATPPELLLPMLKGKKIILVGDHHQLPPLLGNDTLEETLQEMADSSDDFEGKAELNKLLKESLFERLFKSLPKSNKTMLAIQYRMHENIMETIAPFYEQESDRLQCGLTDSDAERDHLLESALIKRNNHLLWLDMPNEPAFFEERMKGGKSLFNPSELEKIGAMLTELDEAVAAAKRAGRMDEYDKKSVGVISFYGEQVKRIDRLIQQELRLQHLTIRTGTVDRFQGMEMDVILLSMVRNHDNKQDDIGFAKDYRRLNVALSRARELLILIGSTKMYTERAKHKDTRQMYSHVLEAAKKQGGLRMLEEVMQLG